jgi:hypothetical protein
VPSPGRRPRSNRCASSSSAAPATSVPCWCAPRARGHTLTLFNRGKTAPGLFPDIETILGDRRFDIDKLKGRDWDAVIDTWVMLPKTVRAAAELLKDHVGQYLFVSTISVYKLGKAPLDESSETLTVTPEQMEKSTHSPGRGQGAAHQHPRW